MSFFPGKDPAAGDAFACEAIAHVVVPRTVDLGDGFFGAPRPAVGAHAHGRAVHFLRSFRTG